MTHFSFDIVGFDLDGTLLDTGADLAAAVNHALRSAGRRTLPADRISPMIGGGARHMLAQAMATTGGCDEGELDMLLERLLAYYEANICVHTAPYPGVLDTLDALATHGVRLAVVTNKRESFTLSLLGTLGLTERFACIIGGDTLGPGKAKPSPAPILAMIERCGGGRAAFVGDSIYDMTAAKAAGIPAIAVSFGFLTGPIGELGADAVIDRYDELIPTLERVAA